MRNEKKINTEKNDICELVFILDKSGSMSGLEADTIGGFNSLIEKQKKQSGKCYVSTVLFSGDCQVVHDRVDLNEVEPLTEKEYFVGGTTALLDAVGGAIHHIGNIHKYARAEDVPSQTMFVITTDGYENSSHRYSAGEIKKMISRQEEQYGWTFLFLGANIDAAETAKQYGIKKERAVNYHADKKGTRVVYEALACAIAGSREAGCVQENWARDIDADYKSRK